MIHTSESLKSQDCKFENFHYQLEDGEKYQLTDGEAGWLDFVSGKYSIADHLREYIERCEETNTLIYTIDVAGMSKALQEDGCDHRAACLDDDTALQAIFFYSATEIDLNEYWEA